MAITDLFNQLEKQVQDCKAKGEAAHKAEKAAEAAQNEYSKSLAEVEKLKTQLMNTIGDILPQQNARIRVAS